MNFSGFLGNESIKTKLNNSPMTHAYIISGPNGSGRYTLATIMAAAMLCSGGGEKPCGVCRNCKKIFKGIHPDVITVELEKNSRKIPIDKIRDIRADAAVVPNEADGKVYIIKDAGQIDLKAQNALLKVLEEPPGGVAFILITEQPGELIETVRSRCTELAVRALSDEEVREYLKKTYPKKTADAIELAVSQSRGIIGNAVKAMKKGSDAAEELAERLEHAVVNSSRLEAAEISLDVERLDKRDKQITEDFLDLSKTKMTNLLEKAEIDASLDKDKIYATILMLNSLIKARNSNVGIGHVSGLMLAELVDILK